MITLNDLKQFYNDLDDHPLDPDHRFYVPYLESVKDGDPVADLETRILFSDAARVLLLSGQRGSGKSTELRRLKKQLAAQRCTVFLSDMRNYMNLTTQVEITDFFISIMAGLQDAVEEQFSGWNSGQGYWERLKKFLQNEVVIESINLKTPIADIKASLKDDPDFKTRLQEGLRGHVAKLAREAHAFAATVVDFIRKKTGEPNRKVVYLIDSVEQIRGVGAGSEGVYKSVENLFDGHGDKLNLTPLHVVYTIPPYLIPLCPGIGARLGGDAVITLPSVHVFETRSRAPHAKGLATMQQILGRRIPTWRELVTEEQFQRLALASGGDIRDFFRLVKNVLVRISTVKPLSLPAGDRVVEYAENQLRREMLPIAAKDMEWLARIGRTKSPELESVKALPELARFFDTKLVLNYRNGEDWYDVHPLLHSLINGPTP